MLVVPVIIPRRLCCCCRLCSSSCSETLPLLLVVLLPLTFLRSVLVERRPDGLRANEPALPSTKLGSRRPLKLARPDRLRFIAVAWWAIFFAYGDGVGGAGTETPVSILSRCGRETSIRVFSLSMRCEIRRSSLVCKLCNETHFFSTLLAAHYLPRQHDANMLKPTMAAAGTLLLGMASLVSQVAADCWVGKHEGDHNITRDFSQCPKEWVDSALAWKHANPVPVPSDDPYNHGPVPTAGVCGVKFTNATHYQLDTYKDRKEMEVGFCWWGGESG